MKTSFSQTSITLLDGVVANDPGAARRFVERYRELARIVARAAHVHPADFEKIVEETPADVLIAVRDGRFDRSRGLKKYLKGALYNKIMDARRDRARRPGGGEMLESIPDSDPGPAEQVEVAFEAEWIKGIQEDAENEVRQTTEPINWQAYELVVKHDRKPAEVAESLNMRRSNVDNIVSRAHKRIAEIVRGQIQSEAD